MTPKSPSPMDQLEFQEEKSSPTPNRQKAQALILKSKRLTKERLKKSGEVDIFFDHRRVVLRVYLKEIHVSPPPKEKAKQLSHMAKHVLETS